MLHSKTTGSLFNPLSQPRGIISANHRITQVHFIHHDHLVSTLPPQSPLDALLCPSSAQTRATLPLLHLLALSLPSSRRVSLDRGPSIAKGRLVIALWGENSRESPLSVRAVIAGWLRLCITAVSSRDIKTFEGTIYYALASTTRGAPLESCWRRLRQAERRAARVDPPWTVFGGLTSALPSALLGIGGGGLSETKRLFSGG